MFNTNLMAKNKFLDNAISVWMDGMHKPRHSISSMDVYSMVMTAVRPRVKPSNLSMEKL